jgi:tripartite-type tricarboxylate transporter receptor subunit TctC
MKRREFIAAIGGAAVMVVSTAAMAQEWPSRSILVVSPFAAGTNYDLVARLVLDQVAQRIGQPFVIENRPGGGGSVGVASVVRAEPDGYTFLLSSSAMSTAVILHKSLPYDALHDLEPVALFGGEPSMLLAAPGKGISTVDDLVAAAKANPGRLRFASVGIGSASHLAGERFRLVAGLNVQHIQMGYQISTFLDWCGLSAPAKTPLNIVDKLNEAIGSILDLPAIQSRLERMGFKPVQMDPKQYRKFIADERHSQIKIRV